MLDQTGNKHFNSYAIWTKQQICTFSSICLAYAYRHERRYTSFCHPLLYVMWRSLY